MNLLEDEEEGDKFADAKEVIDELRLRDVTEELRVLNDMSMAFEIDCWIRRKRLQNLKVVVDRKV